MIIVIDRSTNGSMDRWTGWRWVILRYALYIGVCNCIYQMASRMNIYLLFFIEIDFERTAASTKIHFDSGMHNCATFKLHSKCSCHAKLSILFIIQSACTIFVWHFCCWRWQAGMLSFILDIIRHIECHVCYMIRKDRFVVTSSTYISVISVFNRTAIRMGWKDFIFLERVAHTHNVRFYLKHGLIYMYSNLYVECNMHNKIAKHAHGVQRTSNASQSAFVSDFLRKCSARMLSTWMDD